MFDTGDAARGIDTVAHQELVGRVGLSVRQAVSNIRHASRRSRDRRGGVTVKLYSSSRLARFHSCRTKEHGPCCSSSNSRTKVVVRKRDGKGSNFHVSNIGSAVKEVHMKPIT
jgi:hypothetical protein